MAIINLSDKGAEVFMEEAIAVCKSDSGVCGKRLRTAHMQLGKMIGIRIALERSQVEKVAVVVMMRAGLPFALGIADGLEDAGKTVSVLFSTKEKPLPDDLARQQYNLVILSDAVIRTGKGMMAIADQLNKNDHYSREKIIFATNVLDETGILSFEDRIVYTIRVSKNSFIGAAQSTVYGGKGPDTGDRLFSSQLIESGTKGSKAHHEVEDFM